MSQSQSLGREVHFLGKRFKFTQEGGVIALISLALIVMASLWGRYDLLIVGAFLSFLVSTDSLILIAYSSRSNALVKRVHIPEKVVLGSEGLVQSVAIVKRLKKLKAVLIDKVGIGVEVKGKLTAEGQKDVVLKYYVKPVLRGPHKLGPLRVLIPSPLHLTFIEFLYPPTTEVTFQAVLTFYAEEVSTPPPKIIFPAPGAHEVRVSGGYGDFIKLREYVPGDDVRLIYWPATARRVDGSPVVKELMNESMFEVFLVIDPAIHTLLEYKKGRRVIDDLVNAAGSVAMTALKLNDPLGFYLAGASVLTLPPTRRIDYIYKALKELENLLPSDLTRLRDLPDVAGKLLHRGTKVIIFSPLTYLLPRDVKDLTESLIALSLRPSFVVPDLTKYVKIKLGNEVLDLIYEDIMEEKNRLKAVKNAVMTSGGKIYVGITEQLRYWALKAYLGD